MRAGSAWAGLLIKTGKNRERQNVIWNMAGSFCYAFASMVLSFLVLRIIGEEEGGIFSFGYSTLGQQMFIVAYFGIRPFQVTDAAGQFRFGDYLRHRLATCGLALLAGAGYLAVSGYTAYKAAVLFLLVGYKVLDGFADVYESEFQRCGRLYLTGKSNTFRTLLSVGVFLLTLLAGRTLLLSCCAALAAQAAGIWLFDVSVLRQLPEADRSRQPGTMGALTRGTGLLFVSVFLDFYVFSAAKYAIDSCMGDAASGYFNVIFMPTSMINLAAGFVIRPVLTWLTACWSGGQYREFFSMLRKISALILALSLLAAVLAWGLGRPVLAFLEYLLGPVYEGKLTAHYGAFVLVILGGCCYAVCSLYYYVLVILRRQKVIFGIYLAMAAAGLAVSAPFVRRGGIAGAAWAYLLLMAVMMAAFVVCALGACRKDRKRNA